MAADPYSDRLSARTMPVIEKVKPLLSGSFLDVGSFVGWVYPQVRDLVEYKGIDNWEDAVKVAKSLHGERFACVDLRDYKTQHDIVFCSQLGPETEENDVQGHLFSLARKMLIVSSPYMNTVGATYLLLGVPNLTAVWVK